jgi:hypothetical protein
MLADEKKSGQSDRAGEIAIKGNMTAGTLFVW